MLHVYMIRLVSWSQGMIDDGTYIMERRPVYYIYELIMDGRHQTGLVACSSIDDYMNGVIKKHENTREDKEIDRIKHVEACGSADGTDIPCVQSDR